MRVLVIGSGGREHALVWKIAQSKLSPQIFCAPGNAGIAQQAACVDIKASDIKGLLSFALEKKIDLIVVGPEVPLVAGIVDEFERAHLKIFGPSKKASQLEGSKAFAKSLMARLRIPTAEFKIFDKIDEAKKYLCSLKGPYVIKADGLAGGKGVVIADSLPEAENALTSMMVDGSFGPAGKSVIIEECLSGEEVSVLALVDKSSSILLASSQDHKRVFDNDRGPNTGGMGAYSPAPIATKELLQQIQSSVIDKIIGGLKEENIAYRGILYAGIMVTSKGPQVLEFNVRFGDPETQAILPRLKSDFLELLFSACQDRLSQLPPLQWEERSCVCVVCASAGYPAEYQKGIEIRGLAEANEKDTVVFHAGTQKKGSMIVTDGGRVLGVTGLGTGVQEAIEKTYAVVRKISFDGMHYRRDIAQRAVDRLVK